MQEKVVLDGPVEHEVLVCVHGNGDVLFPPWLFSICTTFSVGQASTGTGERPSPANDDWKRGSVFADAQNLAREVRGMLPATRRRKLTNSFS